MAKLNGGKPPIAIGFYTNSCTSQLSTERWRSRFDWNQRKLMSSILLGHFGGDGVGIDPMTSSPLRNGASSSMIINPTHADRVSFRPTPFFE
jgi:hypothetical protein